MKDHMSIPEFYWRFPNEAACAAFIAKRRWGTEPVCPHCGGTHVYRVSNSMGFKCAGCKKHFSVRTGTVMEWLQAAPANLAASLLHDDHGPQGHFISAACQGTGHNTEERLVPATATSATVAPRPSGQVGRGGHEGTGRHRAGHAGGAHRYGHAQGGGERTRGPGRHRLHR